MSSNSRPSSSRSLAPRPPTTVGAFQSAGTHQLCRTKSRSEDMCVIVSIRRVPRQHAPTGLVLADAVAHSCIVRRDSPPTARLLFHALLALTLMLNGAAVPAAGAAASAPDAALHAQHHGQDSMPDQVPADVPANAPAPDCCDGKTCGCGCAVPQAAALQLSAAPRQWANSPAGPALVQARRASGQIATPFRPPA